MNPELKRIHSPDIKDLLKHQPDDPQCFSFLIQAMIGVKGETWEESFDVEVCTPKWLQKNYTEDDILISSRFLIVQKYDYQKIVETINKFLAHCKGETWNDLAAQISRMGRWEFEDYSE